MNERSAYWAEAVAGSLDEHGVTATDQQIAAIASDIKGCHEVYGEATGRHARESALPTDAEQRVASLQAQLELERQKTTCWDCGGSGYTPFGTAHRGTCMTCNGQGKVVPK